MPRYSDQWLIDRTMFDYVQGGSCACCVGSFLFMPGGTAGIIETMSEFDTDSKRDEIAALHQLPWPVEMKDEVWMERVRLRQYCKRTMKRYKEFWDESSQPTQIILSPEPTTAQESESSTTTTTTTTTSRPLSQTVPRITFEEWFMSLDRSQLAKYFQLPRTEPLERIQQDHHHQQPKGQKPFLLHPAFGTVLCAVTDQVAHFNLTCYPSDGRGKAELGFEDILAFHKRGGFTLIDDSVETRRKWLLRHQTLGGPKLLEQQNDDNSNEEEGDNTATGTGTDSPPLSIPSFRSDRRIMRLLIARCFADTLQSAYLKNMKELSLASETTAESVAAAEAGN